MPWGFSLGQPVPQTQQDALPINPVSLGKPGVVVVFGGRVCRYWDNAALHMGQPTNDPLGIALPYNYGTGWGVTSDALDLRGCTAFNLVLRRTYVHGSAAIETLAVFLFPGMSSGATQFENVVNANFLATPGPCYLNGGIPADDVSLADHVISLPWSAADIPHGVPAGFTCFAVSGNMKIVVANFRSNAVPASVYTFELWGQG